MTASPPQRLKNGNPSHELTTEDRRRGAAKTNAIKAERRKTVRELMAEATEAHFRDLLQVLLDGIAKGEDIDTRRRTLETWLDQAFGRPAQAITGKDGGPLRVEHTDMAASRERFAERVDELAQRRQAKTGSGG